MVNLTLKNIPDRLHRKLKAQARRHGRSLNREAIACLEEATRVEDPELRDWLDEVRKERSRAHFVLREHELEEAIEKGRR